MIPHAALIDALADARLERLHLSEGDLRRGSPSWAAVRHPGDPFRNVGRAKTMAGPSLRVRLGHGLLALGAAIAGEERPNHAQRVA